MKNLILITSVLALVFFPVSLVAQTRKMERKKVLQELLLLKGQNLFDEKKYESRKKADEFFNQLAFNDKERQEREKFKFWGVRYIWESDKNQANPKFVVMESSTFIVLPGQQTHKFYFLDKNANLLNTEDFSTGWRMVVGNVELINKDEFEFPIVKINAWGGGSFAYARETTQYYALLEDSVILIRLESKSNSIFNLDNRNSYGCKYPSIGPKIPDRSIEKWVDSLNSADKAEILRTLMWLAGKHEILEELNDEQKEQDRLRERDSSLEKWQTTLEKCPEIVQDIKTYESVKQRQDVQKRLQELANSSNLWIKEAAGLASNPIEKRKGY